MKQNSKGYYCSTPTKKSPDGKTVLEWCTWKPSKEASPERQQLESKVLTILDKKLDLVLVGQNEIKQMLASIGGRTQPEPSVSDKPLPF